MSANATKASKPHHWLTSIPTFRTMIRRTYMRADHVTKASTVTAMVAPRILDDASSAGFDGDGIMPAGAPASAMVDGDVAGPGASRGSTARVVESGGDVARSHEFTRSLGCWTILTSARQDFRRARGGGLLGRYIGIHEDTSRASSDGLGVLDVNGPTRSHICCNAYNVLHRSGKKEIKGIVDSGACTILKSKVDNEIASPYPAPGRPRSSPRCRGVVDDGA